MSLHVSRRELKKAWQSASKAYTDASNKTNAHRLLLFYAVKSCLPKTEQLGRHKTI